MHEFTTIIPCENFCRIRHARFVACTILISGKLLFRNCHLSLPFFHNTKEHILYYMVFHRGVSLSFPDLCSYWKINAVNYCLSGLWFKWHEKKLVALLWGSTIETINKLFTLSPNVFIFYSTWSYITIFLLTAKYKSDISSPTQHGATSPRTEWFRGKK